MVEMLPGLVVFLLLLHLEHSICFVQFFHLLLSVQRQADEENRTKSAAAQVYIPLDYQMDPN